MFAKLFFLGGGGWGVEEVDGGRTKSIYSASLICALSIARKKILFLPVSPASRPLSPTSKLLHSIEPGVEHRLWDGLYPEYASFAFTFLGRGDDPTRSIDYAPLDGILSSTSGRVTPRYFIIYNESPVPYLLTPGQMERSNTE